MIDRVAKPAARKLLGPAPSASLWAKCDAEITAIDQLVGALRLGIRDQRHFDELEADAAAIGKRLRDAFRGAR